MIPSHHPHSETLISYASGTLPSAVACVLACHLSMCVECADQVRWLEMLGGVMLGDIEIADAEPALTERAVAQLSVRRRACEAGCEPMTKIDDALLPMPLARYLGINAAEISWKPIGSGEQERSITLPKGFGSIKLLQLSPGQRLPEHSRALETEVALVLQGACRDNAGYYVRGDIIERTEPPLPRPMVSGEAKCVCLIADQAAR